MCCVILCTLESSSQGVGGPAHAPAVAKYSQIQAGKHSRLQRDSSVGAAPVRYVNYLAYENYSVEIIGGKHFKTPDGEFVEIKSGTQYKIHVKNSRTYGKDRVSCAHPHKRVPDNGSHNRY